MTNLEQNNTQGTLASLRDARRELEAMKQRANTRLATQKEVSSLLVQVRAELARLLVPDSDAYRVLDRLRHKSFWRLAGRDEYATSVDEEELSYWMSVIDKVSEAFQATGVMPPLDAKDEHIVRVGEKFKAQYLVWEVVKGAATHLVIVDQYLDEEILPFLESIDQSVSVHLVTGTRKPVFGKLLASLKQTRPAILAKVHSDCHDRFFIVDDAAFWHLGASFNTLGKKETLLSRMRDPVERRKLLDDYASWWSTGTDL